jgi:hypothetical protein
MGFVNSPFTFVLFVSFVVKTQFGARRKSEAKVEHSRSTLFLGILPLGTSHRFR